ncbi:hypothetical protein Pmani_014426 [Petrolisthes manimaculis]|uniref:Uncharacterized protein n=1 Tax=Petrolisthes manimaculis TaxID=1843537 RepID=A0AAE1PU12_9EUCA|nr:hypothetical protein Pmani_014426 [Petrolisthes manimaculis]
MSLVRDYLRRLADYFHELSGHELSDVMLSLATMAEGSASMATYNLQGLSRKFLDARIAARQAAAKAAPEMAQRGVIRPCSFSPALFDQTETDAIFSSFPAVINLPKQTVQK